MVPLIGAALGAVQTIAGLARKRPEEIGLKEYAPGVLDANREAVTMASKTVATGAENRMNAYNRSLSNITSNIRRGSRGGADMVSAVASMRSFANRFLQGEAERNDAFRFRNRQNLMNVRLQRAQREAELKRLNQDIQQQFEQDRSAQINAGVGTMFGAMATSQLTGQNMFGNLFSKRPSAVPYVERNPAFSGGVSGNIPVIAGFNG